MINFPEVQQIAQEELDRVVGRDNLPSMTQQSKLNYTQAMVYEIMRHANIAPFSGNFGAVQCQVTTLFIVLAQLVHPAKNILSVQ
jgi:hypothetical protein